MTEIKPTRQRLVVMGMLFISVAITFLDRSNISITAPAMRTELKLDTEHMGWILSGFGWTYAFFQIPGGWLVDRIRPRYLYPALLILWSLATAFLGLAAGFVSLFALRVLIGALEAPSYSINNMVVSSWFPDRERAGAIGFYTSAQFLGLAFLTPLLARDSSGKIVLAGAGAGGPNGTAAIIYAALKLAGGRQLGRPSDLRSTGVAPYATVNAISCDTGACVPLPDPGGNGLGASADAVVSDR